MFKETVLFTKEECNEIRMSTSNYSGALDGGTYYVTDERGKKIWNVSSRKSKVAFFNSDIVKDIILSKISSLDSSITSLPKTVNIVKYNKGDYFEAHSDISSDVGSKKRLKTIIIQLSDNTYDGCILKVYENHTNHICSSEIGNTVIFDSIYKHEVTPMLKGERYALVCWIGRDNVKQKQTII
jgi:predicted 2-oxoglutarate/Fe(II)-dependent dioxygenase YbiX